MINREKRDKAAALIKRFMNGEITNDDFVNNYPRDKSDRALREIENRLWFYWDDLRTHKLEGKYELKREDRELFGRCSLFLSTDLKYEWPKVKWISLWYPILRLIRRPDVLQKKFDAFKQFGNYDVWPFLRRSDYEQALRTANEESS